MAKIPFSIDYRPQIESGEYKVILDCGVEVEILAWDKPGGYPIVCMAKKDEAIPFRVNNNGKAYQFPEGANYSDLFIVKPEELTPFEAKLIQFSDERNSMECDNLPEDREDEILTDHLHRKAAELLSLAREQFVKDGYVIEKKAFHDAVKKVSPEIMKEVSKNVDMQIALRTEYEKGREDALKDLPRWKLFGNGACGGGERPIALVKNPVGYNLTSCLGVGNEKYIMLSDLEKLPGFKED